MVLNKIGLTGATGMLGRHVHAALEKAGAQVVAVSRRCAADSEVRAWNLADWLSLADFDYLFAGVQAIVHTGAMVQTNGMIDEGCMFDTNVRACVNLGQWAISRGVPIIHISSSTVYVDITSGDLREDAPLGWSGLGGFYGFSKLLAEDVLERLRQQGLKLAVVRPSAIYGFGSPAAKMAGKFLATAREGGVIELAHPVDDRFDLIHAADVSLAILAILRADAWDIFNIAYGHPVSIKEFAEACISVTGRGSVFINEDKSQARDPITRFALNTGRARNSLGWQAMIDIKRGLRMMLQECIYADGCESGH